MDGQVAQRWRWRMSGSLLLSVVFHGALLAALILLPRQAPPRYQVMRVSLHVTHRSRPPAPAKPALAPKPKETPAPKPPTKPVVRHRAKRRVRALARSPRPAKPRLAPIRAPTPLPPPPAGLPAAAPGTGPGLEVPSGDPLAAGGEGAGGVLLPPPPPPPPPPRPKPKPPPAPPPKPQPKALEPVPLRLLSRRPIPVRVDKALYPDAARRAGLEGSVLLDLLLDERGRVRTAVVRRSLGFGCDEAARSALLHSRWEPALDRTGHPVPTRIRYRYQFALD